MRSRRGQLDPRAWLLWAVAAGLPPLLGRNPFVLIALLLACLGVRGAVVPATAATASWAWIIRLAALFAVIGAVFNLLTVHIGDQTLATIPGSVPIVGGSLTWNALAYGLLSGLAILNLVIIGVTLAACLDHAELLRMLPGRLTTVAVAGSVALAFLPQTVTALREIREAQAARGYRLRGARGLVPLIVPLLTGGLERAMTLAEALEARGFGAPLTDSTSLTGRTAGDSSPRLSEGSRLKPTEDRRTTVVCSEFPPSQEERVIPSRSEESLVAGWKRRTREISHFVRNDRRQVPAIQPRRRSQRGRQIPPERWSVGWRSIATGLGLTGCAAGAYLLAVGNARTGLPALALGLAAIALAGWESRNQQQRRTRYRQNAWSRRDTIVAIAALITLAVEIAVLKLDSAAFQYQPYPAFTAPPINLWLLAAFALLLAPAVIAPVTAGDDEDDLA